VLPEYRMKSSVTVGGRSHPVTDVGLPLSERARVPVTVLVNTLNEEASIRACLESVRWAAEIVVLDSFSNDRTVDIAREFTDQVIQVPFVGAGELGKKRNWAMSNIKFGHEWVLMLDADDIVPQPLANEIAIVLQGAKVDGFLVSQEYHFMRRPLKHSLGKLYQLKLFRHRCYSCDEAIHEQPIFTGSIGKLVSQYIQLRDLNIEEYIRKHNAYSTREAELYFRLRSEPVAFGIVDLVRADPLKRRQMLKRLWVRVPFRPPLLFLVFYLFRLGFLDGMAGFRFALIRGIAYEYAVGLKLGELHKRFTESDTRSE
jgi:glycosyltransferase involved in cell wall biosynthesis